MSTVTHGFTFADDRLHFDFGACRFDRGWAQVDTGQDASYYGQWANPFTFQVFRYAEGDTTLIKCDSAAEFAQELRGIRDWNDAQGHRFLGIDPGLDHTEKASNRLLHAFVSLGLTDLFHEFNRRRLAS